MALERIVVMYDPPGDARRSDYLEEDVRRAIEDRFPRVAVEFERAVGRWLKVDLKWLEDLAEEFTLRDEIERMVRRAGYVGS
ncbi:MAG: hypothetical protein JNK72_04000 [Myxococcales bacterium]|nr:hypothetical protein [Myxococcales bacterium]